MMTVLPAIAAGVFAATHAASWGAYKDSPFEGFRWRSYARSFSVAAVVAAVLSLALPVHSAASAVVLVGCTYAIERLSTEWWKSIVRNDDQAAYTIPMRLGIHGRPIDSPALRYIVGLGVLAVTVAGLAAVRGVQLAIGHLPTWAWLAATVAVGSTGGWATAIGGAWKDAPIEGFSFWKFLRSPAVAALWALPLAGLTSNWPALVLTSAGFAVVTIETYKTFFTRGRPPGKFAGNTARSIVPRVRALMAVQNASWWIAFGVLLASCAPLYPVPRIVAGLDLGVAAAAVLVAPALSRRGVAEALVPVPVSGRRG